MTQWISVKDRMPELECHYLVHLSNGTYQVAFFENDEWRGDDFWFDEDDVIYWMPIPTPPKEEV